MSRKNFLYFFGIFYSLFFIFGIILNYVNRNDFIGVLWLTSTTILFVIAILIIIYNNKIKSEDISIFIIFIGFFIGLILSFTPISLSDDIYRYFFNSFLIQNGLNPNFIAPNDPSISNLVQNFPWISEIFRPDVKNPYPIMMVFSTYIINQTIGFNLNLWRILMTILVLLTSLILRKILISSKHNSNLIILWAWNPLVLFEFSHSGHNDIIVILILVITLFFTNNNHLDERRIRRNRVITGMLWALAISLKFFPILIIPFFLHKLKKIGLISFGIFIFIFFIPSFQLSSMSNSGLISFLQYFRFNGGIFELLPLFIEWVVKNLNSIFDTQILFDKTYFKDYLRYINLLVFVIIWISLIVYFYMKKIYLKLNSTFEYSLISLLLFLILSPIVHPWYLLWGLPLFLINRSVFSYFIFGLIVNITYFFFVCLCEDPILLLIEYFLVYFFIVINVITRLANKIEESNHIR